MIEIVCPYKHISFRLKKRRARLITATEEAFSHIKRVNTDSVKGKF